LRDNHKLDAINTWVDVIVTCPRISVVALNTAFKDEKGFLQRFPMTTIFNIVFTWFFPTFIQNSAKKIENSGLDALSAGQHAGGQAIHQRKPGGQQTTVIVETMRR